MGGCLIIGGAGMLGLRLAKALAAKGTIGGTPLDAITLFDVVEAPAIEASWPPGSTIRTSSTARMRPMA